MWRRCRSAAARCGADPAAAAAGRAHARAVGEWPDAGRRCGAAVRATGSARRCCMCWRRWAGRASGSRSVPPPPRRLDDVDPLNLVGVEVAAEPGARDPAAGARAAGGLFEHDGQFTKAEVRAVTLASLAPRAGRIAVGCRLWLRLGRDRVVAAPSRQPRHRHRGAGRSCSAGRAQCVGLGVPHLRVVTGEAPARSRRPAAAGCGVRGRRSNARGHDSRPAGRRCAVAAGWWPTPSPSRPKRACSTARKASAARCFGCRSTGWMPIGSMHGFPPGNDGDAMGGDQAMNGAGAYDRRHRLPPRGCPTEDVLAVVREACLVPRAAPCARSPRREFKRNEAGLHDAARAVGRAADPGRCGRPRGCPAPLRDALGRVPNARSAPASVAEGSALAAAGAATLLILPRIAGARATCALAEAAA